LTTITTCQESQLKERMGENVVIENIHAEVVRERKSYNYFPFLICKNATKAFSDGREF